MLWAPSILSAYFTFIHIAATHYNYAIILANVVVVVVASCRENYTYTLWTGSSHVFVLEKKKYMRTLRECSVREKYIYFICSNKSRGKNASNTRTAEQMGENENP